MNIAFIPARCGSKSIPFKNIKDFCGKPLIYWNLLALENTELIDKVYVATNCEKIVDVINKFGFSKVNIYIRDEENALDESSTESVMLEFLSKYTFNLDDLFLLVQATSPITQSSDFDNAILKLKENNYDSLLTVVREKRFFWNENAKPVNYDYNNRPRRQDFNGFFLENGAFYINSIENILQHRNRLSGNIGLFEMHDYSSIEIDEPADWVIAEEYMKSHILIRDKNSKIKLFLSDVDGVMTDAGMYYDQNGNELKKFNTHDGKGFEFLRNAAIKTGIITSENTRIVEARAKKLKVDYLYQGREHSKKLDVVKKICEIENISLDNVAYIGDDVNCFELLSAVGYAACPSNSLKKIKAIPNILVLEKSGGDGAVREFIDILIENNL